MIPLADRRVDSRRDRHAQVEKLRRLDNRTAQIVTGYVKSPSMHCASLCRLDEADGC